MPLPEEWDTINWQQTVVILPNQTEGVPTIPISKDKYPSYPQGYYMMAYLDSNRKKVVGYNAADVGQGGKQLSEFVFWHEMGHHKLGHTGNLRPDSMEVTYTFNKELDADQYSCHHWLMKRTLYGIEVVLAAINHFKKLGNAPGDTDHPAPYERLDKLINLLKVEKLCRFIIYSRH